MMTNEHFFLVFIDRICFSFVNCRFIPFAHFSIELCACLFVCFSSYWPVRDLNIVTFRCMYSQIFFS